MLVFSCCSKFTQMFSIAFVYHYIILHLRAQVVNLIPFFGVETRVNYYNKYEYKTPTTAKPIIVIIFYVTFIISTFKNRH